MRGTVKKWNKSQGYGLILSDENNKEFLVHYSDLIQLYNLEEGKKVTFQIDNTGSRPKAVQVKALKEDNMDEKT